MYINLHFFLYQAKSQLLAGLSSLPAPKNDYEIVVPEDALEEENETVSNMIVEDQADVEARHLQDLIEQRKKYFSNINNILHRLVAIASTNLFKIFLQKNVS